MLNYVEFLRNNRVTHPLTSSTLITHLGSFEAILIALWIQ